MTGDGDTVRVGYGDGDEGPGDRRDGETMATPAMHPGEDARRRGGLPPWLWAPFVLALDLVTKRLVLENVDTLRGRVEVLGDLVRFIYVRNPGAAMGLFPVGRWVLVAVSVAAVIFLVHLYLRSSPGHRLRRSAIAAIVGGALGNLVDRLFYDGLVVDFIDVGIGSARFYTFNVADMGVTIGGALLFLSLLLDGRARAPAGDEREPGAEDRG
ncbi:MAG: signal peptidase II [Candidatus Krumholzibacteriia bacterium]